MAEGRDGADRQTAGAHHDGEARRQGPQRPLHGGALLVLTPSTIRKVSQFQCASLGFRDSPPEGRPGPS